MHSRRKTLSEGEAAEEQGDVNGVSSEAVAEEGEPIDIAREEACRRMGIAVQKRPDSEIGYEEKLQGAEKGGASDSRNAATFFKQAPDHDAEGKAGVNERTELVESEEEVTGEHGQHGGEKRQAAVANHSAGKERQGTYRCEIPGVRRDAEGGGEYQDREN